MIRLTIAHYYTPSGRCIQKPYAKGEKEDYAQDIEKRFKHGELYSADSIHFNDSLRCYTLRKHRTVYGGGGIMPDVFVPLDTTQYTAFHRQLVARSLVINATLRYVENHREELKAEYTKFDDYMKHFEVPQAMVDSLFAEAERQKVKPRDDEERNNTLPMLRVQLKALIARDIWDMNEYFRLMNEHNHTVSKAVELISGK